MSNNLKNVLINGAHIWARNFTGREDLPYNPAGRRNFCVSLDPDLARDLREEGWNVKFPDPDSDRLPYLSVNVSYENYPPQIFKVTSHGKTLLDEDNVGTLDDDEIENVDLIIRPYQWDVGGRSGVKAYVKKMYVTIVEDELDAKYAD